MENAIINKNKYTETHRRCVKEWKLDNPEIDKRHQQKNIYGKKKNEIS